MVKGKRTVEELLAAAMFQAGRGRAPSAEELAIMVAARKPQPKVKDMRRKRRRVVDMVSGMLPFGSRHNGS
jgi:hypothetical protein